VEKITQQLLKNLKHVSAVSVDQSNYKNGGGFPSHHMAYDDSENKQTKEDRMKDITMDN